MGTLLRNVASHPVPLQDGRSVAVGAEAEVDKVTGVTKDAVDGGQLVAVQQAKPEPADDKGGN